MKSHRQLEGMSITGKISNGQEEVPLEHIITCGREPRVPEAYSLKRWNTPMWDTPRHLAHEQNVLGQHEKLRGAISLLKSPRCRFLQPSQIGIPTLYASGVQLGQSAESL